MPIGRKNEQEVTEKPFFFPFQQKVPTTKMTKVPIGTVLSFFIFL
ncbi:Uncharacterised protein [Mycobacteroides abscessus subsp. abscessus]|nr:Uncharacterised protein [Mycobacteroides abscessus subsp. abscessus]